MILVVDDSALIRSLVTAALAQVNVQVCQADSAASALRVCSREHIEVVLLDVELDGENGLDICAKLKTTTNTAQIPIVLMSGYAEDEMDALGLIYTPDYYLPKPFTLCEIQAVVQQALGRR
ncbi:MAG: response regulator [Herpetosiphonaceae bacterium]|nr:response regulator [Herpetosiphonaceae bacterium]